MSGESYLVPDEPIGRNGHAPFITNTSGVPFTATRLQHACVIRKVVIFTAGLQLYSVRKGIAELVQAFPQFQWLILEYAPRKHVRVLLRNQWRNLKKNGWRWIPYQVREIAGRLFRDKDVGPSASAHLPGRQYVASAILGLSNVCHRRVEDLNSEDTLNHIRTYAPDVGISLAAPILRAPLFEIPRHGTINLHKGKLPDYRGMPPGFWELFNGETRIGCTVHRVERGLDTGPVLLESSVTRSRYATVRGVQLTLDEVGVRLMCDALRVMSDGTAAWIPQSAGGRTYAKPTLKQAAVMQKQTLNGGSDPLIKRVCKDAFFWSYVRLARPLARRYLGWRHQQRLIVLLYHRVNDELRDSLTVGIEDFDAQMQWLRSHHTLVSISDIVHGKVPRDTHRPVIAVTFDDGYLDNYVHAVPILLRHQVPAAFFVSTGLIGTNDGFAHDRAKLGRPLPTMNWEQLRHMHDLGFIIGSHTVTHLDCGRADLETVRRELIQSRDSLRQNLGLKEVIFAYPFGGRENMNSAVLHMVEESGYAGCLSAYGGYTAGRINPYNIERASIGSNHTMLAFRARLEGY